MTLRRRRFRYGYADLEALTGMSHAALRKAASPNKEGKRRLDPSSIQSVCEFWMLRLLTEFYREHRTKGSPGMREFAALSPEEQLAALRVLTLPPEPTYPPRKLPKPEVLAREGLHSYQCECEACYEKRFRVSDLVSTLRGVKPIE